MRSKAYSLFLTRIAGLMGMSADDLQADEQANINGFMNRAIRDGWERTNWPDLCPYGEARFAGNVLEYPTKVGYSPAFWGIQNLTAAQNSEQNPLDGQITAAHITEDAVSANFVLEYQQAIPVIGGSDYGFCFYARALGDRRVQLSLNDGAYTIVSVEWDLFNGVVTTFGGASIVGTPSMTPVAGGYYLCQVRFTASENSVSLTQFRFDMMNSASAVNYQGVAGYGMSIWGLVLAPLTETTAGNLILPLEVLGMRTMDVVFNVWQSMPTLLRMPVQARYSFVPDGIQLYSNSGTQWYPWTPSLQESSPIIWPMVAFVYYRKACPEFTGDDYSASATYSVDDQIYFTDSDDVGNYWKCVVATSAGQSPDTTAASWELLEIPAFLFDFIVYKSYSDWLRVEGQQAKAQLNVQNAEDIINQEFDKMERQQGFTLQTKMQTHVTSQPR